MNRLLLLDMIMDEKKKIKNKIIRDTLVRSSMLQGLFSHNNKKICEEVERLHKNAIS